MAYLRTHVIPNTKYSHVKNKWKQMTDERRSEHYTILEGNATNYTRAVLRREMRRATINYKEELSKSTKCNWMTYLGVQYWMEI